MGKKLQGIARDSWTGILLTYSRLIPHYPGTTLIKPARIPPPPRLTGDLDVDALRCWDAYEATARHYFPAIGRAGRPPSLEQLYKLPLRQHRILDRAAALLYEHKTQPMVWCGWRMKSWQTYGPLRWRGRRPPMGWVFAPKHIKERDEAFVWSGASEVTSRVVLAPAHKTLIAKWERMRASLMQAHVQQGLTEERVSSIVRGSLSASEFQRLAYLAFKQTAARQADIDHSIASGEYLWG